MLPQRQDRLDFVQAYERALLNSQQVRMLPIDLDLARKAVILRGRHSIKVPDALEIAAALQAGPTAFVTNDRRLAYIDDTGSRG